MPDVGAQVRLSGPLFDGRAQRALADFLDHVVEAVAEQGVDEVRRELHQVLQNPTGFYESQIAVEEAEPDRDVVTDSGVVYGPWLAGESSRNATSSFKGYRHWQRATQRLDSRAAAIAQRELPPFLARMNG